MNSKNDKIVIAVDGFSSSGKSTMARELAARIGYVYVDSGAMYRAVTLYALRHGMFEPDDVLDVEALVAALSAIKISFNPAGADGVQHTMLNDEDVEREIREMAVSNHVSFVAEVPQVRSYLVELQQRYGDNKGIVMDGRDIGTTVFPQAEMKVFVNASPEVRAQRRVLELEAKGENTTYDAVLKNIQERDHIDSTRKDSPLRRAEDAVDLDNSRMSHAEQMEWLMNLYNRILADRKEVK